MAGEDFSDSRIIGSLLASDPEGDGLSFSIVTNDNDLFEVAMNGSLSLDSGKDLDYENATEHVIIARVNDGRLSSDAPITINVFNVISALPLLTNHTFRVREDFSDVAIIGTLLASPADDDNLIFSIITNDSDLFEVAMNGELSLSSGKNLNYESTPESVITVQLRDGDTDISNSASITIEVTDVVDEDGDGLIEIYDLVMLHNMRYDLDGSRYKASSNASGNTNGCPGGECGGYELVSNLSFDADGDGMTWSGNNGSYTLDSNDNHPVYFNVSEGGWEPVGDSEDPFSAIFEGMASLSPAWLLAAAELVLACFNAPIMPRSKT